MVCQHCGNELQRDDLFCGVCGYKVENLQRHCPNCGKECASVDKMCSACGYALPKLERQEIRHKSKMLSLFFACFLAGTGIHNFYLGYSSKGIMQLGLFCLGFFTGGLLMYVAMVWSWVEAILLMMDIIYRDGDDNFLK